MTAVLWVAPSYPWLEDPVGGVFHQTQARALARLGVDVTVASPVPVAPWPLRRLHPRWGRYARAPQRAVDEGVSVIRPRYLNLPGQPSRARPDRLMARAVRREREALSKAKVIHGHSAVAGLAAWRLAREAGLPYVLTFHGGDINEWPDLYPERLQDLRSAVRGASAVLAVSRSLADRIQDLTGVAATHLPLGSDHRAIASLVMPKAEARRALGIPDDRIVVLFVGYLIPRKGVRELATAVLDVGDPFLGIFVGGGPEAGQGTQDRRAAGLLDYRGQQTHDTVIRYMSAADVLVLPSYSEGLPTVLVEAGSVGVPIIASAVDGIPELLGGDRGTLLPEISPAAISSALKTFRHGGDDAMEAAARLRRHVLEAYDVDRNAAVLAGCYDAVMAPPHRWALA